MSIISDIRAREVLDSRGYPALEVDLTLDNTVQVRSAVPSGASTGTYEALELRDRDSHRFKGKGLLKALAHINTLSNELKKHSFNNQSELDTFLIKWDGTDNKSRVGANTILAVSLAYAKATALTHHQELFESFKNDNYMLPVPLINILNGGAHANNGLNVQEFMIVPYGFDSFKEALRAASEIFYTLKELLKKKGLSTSVGDEGGFAPLMTNNESALKLLLQAIEKGGYSSENQVALALDVAASEFYTGGKYRWEQESIEATDLIGIYRKWRERYPLISMEDGLAEEDWAGWTKLTKELGKNMQLVGDDLFVTQERRLKKGIDKGVANCLLAKINQVGTLTETHLAIQLAYEAGYSCCISHRSGETEDVSIADLAVAWGVKQIKTGSVCRGERVAKYNRCLRIEEKLGNQVEFAGKKAFSFL